MEIAKSFEELQELIGKDLAEEVVASYPNIINEKVINYYLNQLDWAESIIYPRAINRIDTKVFSTLYLVDLIDVNYLEEAMYGVTLAEMHDYDTLNAMLLEAQLEEGLTKTQALARLRENNFGY